MVRPDARRPDGLLFPDHPAPWRSGYAAACKAVYTSSILVGASGRTAFGTRSVRPARDTPRVQRALRVLSVVAAYAVTVGGVLVALFLTIPDDPWLPALVALAILHLGFGLLVPRAWTVVLPLLVCVVAVLADVGGFSITTFLVGVPCAMLLLAGVWLRIGWDDGGRARRGRGAREDVPSFEDDVRAFDGRQAYLDDHPEHEAAGIG